MNKEKNQDNGVKRYSKKNKEPSRSECSNETPVELAVEVSPNNTGVDVTDIPEATSKYKWLFILLLNLALVGTLFGYAFMGGAVFVILEHDHEMEQYKQFVDAEEVLKQSIVNLTNCETHPDGIDMDKLEAALSKFEDQMKDIVCDDNVDVKGKTKWAFWSAVFFSATVISTIGYGNIAPVTAAGRAFCMVYAVFGIALLLLVLASLGTIFARGATLGYRAMHLSVMMAKGKEIKPKRASRRRSSVAMVLKDRPEDGTMAPVRQTSEEERRQQTIDDIWKSDYTHPADMKEGEPMHVVNLKDKEEGIERQKSAEEVQEEEEEESEDDVQIPVLGVLLFAFLYICLVAGLLIIWEQWTYFEAFYFSFITLTTIGFGDIVPHHQKNLLSITFFILLGMAIMSMCIALAQDAIMTKIAWASRKIGVAIIKSKPTGK